MSLDAKAALDAVAGLFGGLSPTATVYRGAPNPDETQDEYLHVLVALGGATVNDETVPGVLRREQRVWLTLRYRTDGDVVRAENDLCSLVDQFTSAFYAWRKAGCGGVADSASLDLSTADNPDYIPFGGEEFREYPLLVTVVQRATI